jgi:hypothetical protein
MKILIGVLLMASLIGSKFTVEKLPETELKELTAARDKFGVAQQELVVVERRLQEAHGQTKPTNSNNASCIGGNTVVELRGEYALITSTTYNLCETH